MSETDTQLEIELFNHKVYSAWQFIEYTKKNIDTVSFCYQTINNIISKLSIKTIRWEQNLFNDFVEETTIDGNVAKRITVTAENAPEYLLRVVGDKVDPWFLFDKMMRDFFQYSMNAFDSISQIANAGLLANRGKKVDTVDFQNMARCFSQVTYKTAFPMTSSWFENTSNSIEFQYIEAINNRTKHTYDIANKLSMGILGSSNRSKIGSFFRKDVQHSEKELNDQLQSTIDFLNKSYLDFMDAFSKEFILDSFTDNRRHEISGVYQQKFIDNPSNNFSYAYIKAETDFDSMPNELYVLLAKKTDQLYVHECPFDCILICDDQPQNVLGRYVAEETVGEDCLLSYRKYVKDTEIIGHPCMFYEMQKSTVFYHNNLYFDVTVVSDDDKFIARTTLPF